MPTPLRLSWQSSSADQGLQNGTLTMLAGTAKLIGSWRPTGKPEFGEKDLMHVVFLKIDIQEYGSLLQ